MEITQEMVDEAAANESEILAKSPDVIRAQNKHLHDRVVVLRALVNEQQKELDRLQSEAETPKTRTPRKVPADRQPKKKVASTQS